LSLSITLQKTNYGRSSDDIFDVQYPFRYVILYSAVILVDN